MLLEGMEGGVGSPVLETFPLPTAIEVRGMLVDVFDTYVPALIGTNCFPIPMEMVPKYGMETWQVSLRALSASTSQPPCRTFANISRA